MDLSTWILLGVVGLMAANRLIFLWSGWWRVRAPFWILQLTNLVAASALVIWGIPELKARSLHVFNLVFAGLLVVHILANNRKLQRTVREARRADTGAREAAEAEILSKLKSSEPGD